MSEFLNDCGCCGFGFDRFEREPENVVIVGHSRVPNLSGNLVSLSALDFEGNILWQRSMGLDSFGNRKRPIHIRISPTGFIYVAWNSPYQINDQEALAAKWLSHKLTGFGGEVEQTMTVGGVDKFTRSGVRVWSTELPPLFFPASGGSLWFHYGNNVDVSPYDGTIWTSTHMDENSNYIHQLNPANGTVMQSFGLAEFLASEPAEGFGVNTANQGSSSAVTWIRVTDQGNIWFNWKLDDLYPIGPLKCDSSGNILRMYGRTFKLDPPSDTRMVRPAASILVWGDDDIVISGGNTAVALNYPTPPSPESQYTLVERWQDLGAGNLERTLAKSPAGTGISWFTTSGDYNNSTYVAYWVDGFAGNLVYGMQQSCRGSAGHLYTVFHLFGGGHFGSTAYDNLGPTYTDPRDHAMNPAAVAWLDGHIFVGGFRLNASGLPDPAIESSMVVRLEQNTGRKDWHSDLNIDVAALETGTPWCYCIAAFEE